MLLVPFFFLRAEYLAFNLNTLSEIQLLEGCKKQCWGDYLGLLLLHLPLFLQFTAISCARKQDGYICYRFAVQTSSSSGSFTTGPISGRLRKLFVTTTDGYVPKNWIKMNRFHYCYTLDIKLFSLKLNCKYFYLTNQCLRLLSGLIGMLVY